MTIRRSESDRNSGEDPASETGSSVRSSLLTLRAGFILSAGVMVGVAAGILTYLAARRAADSVLAGGAAFAGSVTLLNSLID